MAKYTVGIEYYIIRKNCLNKVINDLFYNVK